MLAGLVIAWVALAGVVWTLWRRLNRLTDLYGRDVPILYTEMIKLRIRADMIPKKERGF